MKKLLGIVVLGLLWCNVWDEVKGEELISPEYAEQVSISNTTI